jgi:hypothetical protein
MNLIDRVVKVLDPAGKISRKGTGRFGTVL